MWPTSLIGWYVEWSTYFLLNLSSLWMVLMMITDDDYFTNNLLFWWYSNQRVPLILSLSWFDGSQLNPIKAFIDWFAKL